MLSKLKKEDRQKKPSKNKNVKKLKKLRDNIRLSKLLGKLKLRNSARKPLLSRRP